MKSAILGGFLSVLSVGAQAQSAYDMTFTASGVSERDMAMISDSFFAGDLDSAMGASDLTEGHPFYGMTGSCTGYLVVNVPLASGSGVCRYSNGGEDGAVVHYVIEGLTSEGGLSGSWTALGGTGSMSGMEGGGSFVNSATADDGSFTQQVAGAITLP